MSDSRSEAIQQAIDALQDLVPYAIDLRKAHQGSAAIEALRQYQAAKAQLSNREAVAVTDEMALSFYRAITDGAPGDSEFEDIKTGLRAALENVYTNPQPAVPDNYALVPVGVICDAIRDLKEVQIRLIQCGTYANPQLTVRICLDRTLEAMLSAQENTHPQPVNKQSLESELTGAQWSAARKVFEEYANKVNSADKYEMASAYLDAAPQAIYDAIIAAQESYTAIQLAEKVADGEMSPNAARRIFNKGFHHG